jgi:hypothetical protein
MLAIRHFVAPRAQCARELAKEGINITTLPTGN